MRFGIFGSAEAGHAGHGFRDYLEMNVEAETLGFESTFLVEHHFTGMGQVSASLDLLAWVAARTTTLRVGTAVVVLPWHNPVLLAERASTLDLMSGGRLDFGVGKGYRHTEFAGFCMPYEEAEPRFDEALEVIVKAWTAGERFSHRGTFWQFEDVIVEPPPAQQPHPPVWIAAGSPESIGKVAALGCKLLLDQFASTELVGERVALYRGACERLGWAGDVAVARNCYVARNDADAQEARDRQGAMHARMVALARAPRGGPKSHVLAYRDTEASAICGPPDRVVAELEALRQVGVDHVLLNGGNAARASMRRFARDVAPAVS